MDGKPALPPDFPTEVTFKAVFRRRDGLHEEIAAILKEKGIEAWLGERRSAKSTFVSFTVAATFPSEEMLKLVCSRIGALEGFRMMF